MSVRSSIISVFEEVAKEQRKELTNLSDDLVLQRAGLDSLSLAIIVVRLEDELCVDPFSTTENLHSAVTLGDFIGIYENAAT
jgi:acyl carrier protein